MPDIEYLKAVYENLNHAYGKDGVVSKGALSSSYDDFANKMQSDSSYAKGVYENLDYAYGKNGKVAKGVLSTDFDGFYQKIKPTPLPSAQQQMPNMGIQPVGTYQQSQPQPVSHDIPKSKGDIHSLPQVLNQQHPSVQKSDLYLAHPDIHKQAVEDFSFSNGEDKQSVLDKLSKGEYVLDDGKVKVKGGFLDNLGQSAKSTLKNIKLALDIEGAKANKNTDAEAENEIKYHLNEVQKSRRFEKEYAATDLKGEAGQMTGGLLPYIAAGALTGGVGDVPAMGLSNMGERHQEIWNDPKLTEDEKVKAINRMSKDDFMIGALQGAGFHAMGAGAEKATANSLLSKYKPTQKFTQGLFNKLSDLASTTPSDVAKSAGIFGGKELADQLNKSKEGVSADFSKVPESLMQGATFHLLMTAPKVLTTALGTLSEASKKGLDKTDPQWYNSYSKNTQEALNNIVKAPQPLYEKMMAQLDGAKDADSQNAKYKIKTFRGYYNSLPSEMSEGSKDKALHILQLKTEAVSEGDKEKALAYDGLFSKIINRDNVNEKKEPLLIDRFHEPIISVTRPEEINKPKAVTIAPKENLPTEEKRGAAVILPENNKPIEAVHIGGKEYDAPQESNRAAVVIPENNTSPNIVELKKNEQNEGLGNSEDKSASVGGDLELYHGSGSEFDKFDNSKIGTGEAVNGARGHGIYLTDSKDLADRYGFAISDKNITVDGKPVLNIKSNDRHWLVDAIKGNSKEDALDNLNSLKSRFERILNRGENEEVRLHLDEVSKLIDAIGKCKEASVDATSPNVYKTKIKKSNFIDWDNNLTDAQKNILGVSGDATWDETYHKAVDKLGSEKVVSDLLKDNGYDGFKYKSIEPDSKEGDNSFVVFDADNVDISERNGKSIGKSNLAINEEPTTKADKSTAEEKQLPQEGRTETSGNQLPKEIVGQKEGSVEKGFTEAADLNKMYAAAKTKYGEKKGAAIYQVANRLVNPNENTIIDIRSNGVTVKEGDKYIFKPFGNTDANSKKWTLYKGIDVTDQYAKSDNRTTTSSPDKVVPKEEVKTEVSGNKKPVPENTNEVGRGDAKVTATDVKKPTTKVSGGLRAAAKKLREGELPSFLKANLPEGTQKAGFGGKELQEAVAKGLEAVADLIDSGAELAKAIEEGFKHIQDHYKENGAKFKDEATVKKQFEDFVNENLGGVEPIGITHAATDKLAEELGLPDRYEKDPTTRERQDAEAVKRIANGEMPALIEKLKNKEMPSDIEQRMMAHHLGELKAEYENTKSDKLLLEIKNLKELSDIVGGREVGKSLQARQENITHPLDDGEASVKVAHMEALGVNELTDKQKAEYEKQVNEYKAIAENEKTKREAVEKKYKDFLAKKAVDKVKKAASATQRKPKTKTEFVSERKAIIDSIKDKWKKSANDGMLTAVPIPYAKQLMAIAPDVAKLVRSLVEEAMDITLPDLVKKVHDIVKEGVPELTEKDVHDIIAGEYNEKKDTKNELQAKIYELRQEAKLLNEYDRVLRQEPSTEKKKVVRNAKLAELRKKIKTLLDGEPDEIATKIKNTLKANERTAQKYIERIKKGDFENAPKIPFEENFEFKQQHPALFQAAMDAIQKKKDAKTAFDIALENDKISKENGLLKTYRFLGKAKNTLQSMVAGVDDSLMFVQLGYTLVNNPSVAINFRKYTDANGKTKFALGGSIKEHILDAVSKKRFETQMAVLHNSSYWPLIKASGLDVLEPMSLLDRQKEEMFQHNLAEYVGTKKVNLGKFLAIWERAYTSLGNNTRVNLFMRQAKVLYEKGMTIENNLEEFKGLATAINNLTGRGSTNAKIAQVIPYVTPVIWSPKMIASSINLLGISDIVTGGQAGFYTKLPPKARAYAARQMAEGFSIAGGLMLAAALGGHTVHYNPHDPRFGDIEFGEDGSKAINVFGRYGSMMRLVVQLWPAFLGGGRMNSKGITEDVGEEGGKTRGQVAGGFLRGKMNPVSGLAFDYLMNDKKGYYDKKPLTLTQSAKDLTIPMSLRDVRKEMDRDGTISIFNYDLPSFVGMSMKDQRDYYSNQTNDKAIDSFLEKNKLKIPAVNSATVKDENHPNEKATDEEVDKIREARDGIIKKAIEKAMKPNDNGHTFLSTETTPEAKQLNADRIKWMAKQALDDAKEKVLGKTKAPTVKEALKKSSEDLKRDMFKMGVFK